VIDERTPQPEAAFKHRKARDRAFILPVVGLLLLMPPVAHIFDIPATIDGLPVTGVYLFAVWAGLIIGAARLARKLDDGDPEHTELPVNRDSQA
jgi:hypothetical protein